MEPTGVCVVCFNSQWRSVVVGLVSTFVSLFILFLTIGYSDVIDGHLDNRIANKKCYYFVGDTTKLPSPHGGLCFNLAHESSWVLNRFTNDQSQFVV